MWHVCALPSGLYNRLWRRAQPCPGRGRSSCITVSSKLRSPIGGDDRSHDYEDSRDPCHFASRRDHDRIAVDHPRLSGYRLDAAPTADGVRPLALFCDNETNNPRLFGADPLTEFPKDGINDHVISGAKTVNPDERGTKACWWYKITVPAGGAPRYALGSIGLINRPQPRAMDGMAATSKPSWQTGNGKRTSSTPLWRPMTSAKNTCGCYGSRARV
jgi:hypothetical protein